MLRALQPIARAIVREFLMLAIAIIFAFIAILAGINYFEFGRFD
jgi:lipopolysaccharide export LptBFGC system permease protein LptF